MVPCGFEEANCVLSKPPNMSAEECEPLQVWRGVTQQGYPVLISCYKVTAEDLLEIQKTGRIYLYVYGHAQPPVSLAALNPFRSV